MTTSGVGSDVTNADAITTPPFAIPTAGFPGWDPGTSTDIVSYPGAQTELIPVGFAAGASTDADPVAAPEPGGLLLLGSGLAMAARFVRQRRA